MKGDAMKKEKSAEQHDGGQIYMDAKREYSQIYGDYVKRVRQWQVMAIICAMIALVAVCALAYSANSVKIKPYAFYIKDNQAYPLGYAEKYEISRDKTNRANSIEEFVTFQTLLRFIENVRGRTPDTLLQRRLIGNVYAMLLKSTPAFEVVTQYYTTNKPYEKDITILVEDLSIMKEETPNKFTIKWTEKTYKKRKFTKSDSFQGTIDTKTILPDTENAMLENPMGIYVYNISFRKIHKNQKGKEAN